MKILLLAPRPLVTSRMPGSPRLFQLARHLAKRHELFLLHFPGAPQAPSDALADPTLLETFRQIVELPRLGEPRWRNRQIHRLALAPHFATRLTHPREHQEILGLVTAAARRHVVDLLYADGLSMLQYAPETLGLPLVLDVCDCLSLIRRQEARHAPGLLDKLRLVLEARATARHEATAGRRCDCLLVITEIDQKALLDVSPDAKVVVIPNGVDTEYFSPSDEPPERDRLVFTGVMDFGPNEDAVLHFREHILPLIRSKRPEVEFWAVGSGPQPALLELGKSPGVHVTGEVPDIRPYVRSASVYVCPLRLGTGMKNKLLAAMAMRRPVVATPASLYGLDVSHGKELLVADSAQNFADCVIRLLEDHELALRLARRGHEVVKSRFSWSASAAQLDSVLEAVVR